MPKHTPQIACQPKTVRLTKIVVRFCHLGFRSDNLRHFLGDMLWITPVFGLARGMHIRWHHQPRTEYLT